MSYEIIIDNNIENGNYTFNLQQIITISSEYIDSTETYSRINEIINNMVDISGNNHIINNIFQTFFNNDSQPESEIKFNKLKVSDLENKPDDCCPICLEAFTDDEDVAQLDCGHLYHVNCIVKWGKQNQTCPLCKKSIPTS